jgi:hypothetical protein
MSLKVKVVTDFTALGSAVGALKRSKALKKAAEMVAEEIIITILSGKSPVKGERFKAYSKSYAKVKGRRAPVDMVQSGKMLDSLKVKIEKTGTVSIEFGDKKADFHNFGTKRLPIRRLLPTENGQELKANILRKLNREVQKIVDDFVKRANS